MSGKGKSEFLFEYSKILRAYSSQLDGYRRVSTAVRIEVTAWSDLLHAVTWLLVTDAPCRPCLSRPSEGKEALRQDQRQAGPQAPRGEDRGRGHHDQHLRQGNLSDEFGPA